MQNLILFYYTLWRPKNTLSFHVDIHLIQMFFCIARSDCLWLRNWRKVGKKSFPYYKLRYIEEAVERSCHLPFRWITSQGIDLRIILAGSLRKTTLDRLRDGRKLSASLNSKTRRRSKMNEEFFTYFCLAWVIRRYGCWSKIMKLF